MKDQERRASLGLLSHSELMQMRIVAMQCAAAQQNLYHGDVVAAAEEYYDFMYNGPRLK